MSYKHLTALIIFIVVIILLTKKFGLKERFTMLAGLNQLTSFDDAATFQNEFALDNLPYWDNFNYRKAYELKDIIYVDNDHGFKTDKDGYILDAKDFSKVYAAEKTNCGNEDFIHAYRERWDDDAFFNYRQRKVRRELVPGNYSNYNPNYCPARFDQNMLTFVENPNRTRFNTNFAFQGSNIYYDKNE